MGERITRDLGGIPFRVPPEMRAVYHLGAVLSCNLVAALVGESVDLLKAAGMDESRAFQALEPLMSATISNIAHLGLPDAVTGPLKRGDAATIARHLDVLARFPEAEKIYRLLSLTILRQLPANTANEALQKLLTNTILV